MAILPRPSHPREAWRDLTAFLRERRRHEWVFLALALAITIGILVAFLGEFNAKQAYKPPATPYVTQWRADRSRAEIIADQKRDLPAQQARLKEEAAARLAKQKQFQRVAKMMGIE